MQTVPEILLIDKPKGITSFDVIRQLRRQLGIKKMGHAGTLDPLASGLMIIGVGSGTKQLTSLIKQEKEYLAEILLGESRSTGDLEGVVLVEKGVEEGAEIFRSKIYAGLVDVIGELSLPVSAYSAIKVAGVPMYKRARKAELKGERITDVPVRLMQIIDAELLSVSVGGARAGATVGVKFGSGTFIS